MKIDQLAKTLLLSSTLMIFSPLTIAEESKESELKLPVSINALMVTLIDHSAHYVWDYAEDSNTRELTDQEWQIIEYYSVQVAASGPLIMLGGTGVGDEARSKDKQWFTFSKAMSDAGVKSLKAARGKDAKMLRLAGDQLIESCLSCHDVFKPDAPTEGIMHNPEYDHLYHLQRDNKE